MFDPNHKNYVLMNSIINKTIQIPNPVTEIIPTSPNIDNTTSEILTPTAFLHYTCFTLSTIFLIIYLISWSLQPLGLLSCILQRYQQTNVKHKKCHKKQPPVTIIKPIKGIDGNLEENLTSFFTQNYTNYTVHLCLESPHDTAAALCEKLVEKYKKLAVLHYQIDFYDDFLDSETFKNPKIQNMRMAWSNSETELVWMADAKIFAEEDTLENLVTEMLSFSSTSDNTALIHCNPLFKSPIPTTTEKTYFYTQHSRQYCTTAMLGIPVLTGMSVLARRSKIEAFGGLTALEDFLAEDFYLCKFLTDAGEKLRLSKFPALQNPSENQSSVKVFVYRMLRWYKLRKSMVPMVAMMEPMFECFYAGIYGPLSIVGFNKFLVLLFPEYVFWNPSVDISWGIAMVTHWLMWFVFDTLQAGILGMKVLNFGYLKSWIVRHFIFCYIYTVGFFDVRSNIITWSDKKYLLKNSKLIRMPSYERV